jgi:hypothetical protein
VIKPSREENECVAANLTSWASGNIVGAIPDRTKDREIGLIWEIPFYMGNRKVKFWFDEGGNL